MPGSIANQLENARRELLDLTARNRLINTPLARGRSTRLDVVDELSEEVFRILVRERKEMSFLPAVNPDEGKASRAGELPEADESDDEPHFAQPNEVTDAIQDRHTDQFLQTTLEDEKLQTRLLRLYYDARAMFEEQGVNSLYLAMGFLEWYESASSDKTRFAPLLLIPVELHRRTVNARFRVRALEEDITTNLSLQAKLKADFGLQLPDVPDLDDLEPAGYFAQIERIISKMQRWRVHRDRLTIWFFSFAKFLMFRDLDPEAWPKGKGPSHHPLVAGLLGEPIRFEPPVLSEGEPLDNRLDPRLLPHVVDCDSSQAAAIEEVRAGRNIVIQGPPGTGKSQSIVNIIATAVRDGKTVLFVAEKLAALQVVKSRFDRIGLQDICLELHSHKANRRSVLDDLGKTLDLKKPAPCNVEGQSTDLAKARDRLNRYVQQLHRPIAPFGRTPYEIIGTLCRLQTTDLPALLHQIPDIGSWSSTTLQDKKRLLQDIIAHIEEMGVPKEHAWYGIRRTKPLLPTDLQSLQERVADLHKGILRIHSLAATLHGLLYIDHHADELSFQSVRQIAQFALKLRNLPDMDRTAIANPVWAASRDDVDRVVEQVRMLHQCRTSLEDVVTAAAWSANTSQIRADLAATGGSIFRWFSSRWRRAIARFKEITKHPSPKTLSKQLEVLDLITTSQTCLENLGNKGKLESIASAAFGRSWSGPDSDLQKLAAITSWEADCRKANIPRGYLQTLTQWSDTEKTNEASRALREIFKPTWEALHAVVKELEIDTRALFGKDNLLLSPLTTILTRVSRWRQSIAELGRWVQFQRKLIILDESGLGSLRPQIEDGGLDERIADQLELGFCEAAMRRVLEERDEIASFDGITHNRFVAEFSNLDQERIRLARNEVAATHYEGLPSGGFLGAVGIIRGEIKKKRRLRSLRRLVEDAGAALQAIKPVFMMSPTSVAQFLPPGAVHFDLVVIDEASQVRPVEALGAILRCKQAIIVGDSRQLPPTAFFDRCISAEESDPEEDDTVTADVDSVLDLCVARDIPQRMLQWHYRSRHESLIAVSNREFYDNRLFVVPSPQERGAGRGLEFVHIPDGVYDRGKTRTNRREAKAVAQAMIDHARLFPNNSLGVGTFSVAQKDAILSELELLRRAHPETEEFFSRSSEEPWFVKNLENIQGDERDTIFISVGYGPDASGIFAMSFGPLTSKGGERRLNVLISRAKQRCVVFSSIRSEQVDLRRTASRGVEALKSFLQFAETGRIDVNRQSGRDFDSEFEAQVSDDLTRCGWKVDRQVGIAGFFVDLAVVDPAVPGRYILGIECDGAAYHSARWARDRDRLRQAVLEDHGWKIQRIWSTDWFQNRQEQLRKILGVLEDLCNAPTQHTRPPDTLNGFTKGLNEANSAKAAATTEILRIDDGEAAGNKESTVPYQEAYFEHPLMTFDIYGLAREELVEVIMEVVSQEGPIHRDEVSRRVASLWGLQRTGSRIIALVDSALELARQSKKVDELAQFYTLRGRSCFPVRSRNNVQSVQLRKPEMLPPQEIDTAISQVVTDHVSISIDDTVQAVVRLFGFRSTSRQLRARVESRVDSLVSTGKLRQEQSMLRIV